MIRWVSETTGISAFDSLDASIDDFVLDVRDLVDKEGNSVSMIRAKLDEALAARRSGRRVVVCCDYGISRSSAIAAGLIAEECEIDYDDAVRQVVEATGEKSMRIEVLASVRAALQGFGTASDTRIERSVVITGGSGFLGRALAHQLDNQYQVATPTRSEIDLARDTVALDRLVRKCQADTIIHLANPRIYSTNDAIGDSLVSLKNVLDVCVQQDLHLIYPSGWEVFSGYHTQQLLVDESIRPNPNSVYGYAKLLCEQLIAQVCSQRGLRHTIVRVGPVYGVESTRPKFIWNFIGKALRGDQIISHCYENGEPALDLLHVNDVIEALKQVIQHRPQQVIHFGTGTTTSTRVIAELIVSLSGSSSSLDSRAIDGYAANIAMDYTLANRLFDWRPTQSLADGIRELIDYGRLNREGV